ncbi:uncharacterized protein PRCAT00002257001 [Priceomyces carsonii]|uniref:uncharacterized protein n=1 Tax=Priceomyces carsonii TaxID=28549 RepID=UPI002EDACB62|nr:unnamed protein product [Priceomyces carsonii]
MDQEDLTASHWDDVISPATGSSFTNLHSTFLPPSNDFNELKINKDSSEEEEDNSDKDGSGSRSSDQGGSDEGFSNDGEFRGDSSAYVRESEMNQLKELKKEERKEHKHQLLSELVQGSEDHVLELSVVSPERIDSSKALFNDKDSPVKAVGNNHDLETYSSPKRPFNLKNSFKAPRPRKYNPRTIINHLNESDNADQERHLGPLGDVDLADQGDANSVTSKKIKAEQLVEESNAPLYQINTKSEEERVKELNTRNWQTAEVNDEGLKEHDHFLKAEASPLEITVGDPMKVGDITNAHIVYSIKSKRKNSSLTASNFPKTDDFITVSRRYRDFRWVYHQLQNNHPGVIIPPPPTKQTYIGRFNENFIENRRLSLEKMLSKISSIPPLCNDEDFIMFLTSEDFANESKERERLSGSGASVQNNDALDNEHSISGNDDVSNSGSIGSGSGSLMPGGTVGGGFMSSLFSISTKMTDPDDFFVRKKDYIEDLEQNLRNLYKSIELIGTQRLEMISLLDEISLTVDELADLEILKVTSDLLNAFSDVQLKLKENLDRVNLQDQLTLGFTIEEYLRIIGSVKFTFETRMKIYLQFHSFNQDLQKKQAQLDKLNKKYKAQVDKINMLTFEVDKLKQRTAAYEKKFVSISDTIKSELEKFEFQKIDDFRNSVEIFIESSIESQKEAIELWETFYERQNLAKV